MKKILILLVLILGVRCVQAQSKTEMSTKVEKASLLFSDDFSTDLSDWVVHEKFNGAFSAEDGVWVTKEIEGAGHGSTARIYREYKDIVVEFDFQFDGGKRFNIVMDDTTCKTVWAGHVCRVSFSKTGFMVQDDKTGIMNLTLRNQIKNDPNKKKELKDFLDSKKSFVKMNFNQGEWYHVKIIKNKDVLECIVKDKIARLKSEGINHPILDRFGPTITGANILFDNLNIWGIKKE